MTSYVTPTLPTTAQRQATIAGILYDIRATGVFPNIDTLGAGTGSKVRLVEEADDSGAVFFPSFGIITLAIAEFALRGILLGIRRAEVVINDTGAV